MKVFIVERCLEGSSFTRSKSNQRDISQLNFRLELNSMECLWWKKKVPDQQSHLMIIFSSPLTSNLRNRKRLSIILNKCGNLCPIAQWVGHFFLFRFLKTLRHWLFELPNFYHILRRYLLLARVRFLRGQSCLTGILL